MPKEQAPPPRATLESASLQRPRSRTWFHAGLSGALLLSVVVGFSPTFFLRPAFTDRPLPLYLYLHGAVLTLWFVLAFVQSVLVAARRTALHRRLGVVGGLTAAVLVPLSGFVAVQAISRYRAAGVQPAEIQFIVIGDLISLVVFSGLITSALAWRHHRDWHRRLMAVASIMIIGPAIARLERVGLAVPVPAVLLGLLVALCVNDAIELRRLHRATVVSVSVVLVSLGALLWVVGTRTADVVIRWLSP